MLYIVFGGFFGDYGESVNHGDVIFRISKLLCAQEWISLDSLLLRLIKEALQFSTSLQSLRVDDDDDDDDEDNDNDLRHCA
jgi:hypothetical protein